MRAQVAKLGLAAVLAYGLFDGITYTSFFVLAFLGYEKSTGQNPAANLKALLGVSYSCLSLHYFSGASYLQSLCTFLSSCKSLNAVSKCLSKFGRSFETVSLTERTERRVTISNFQLNLR
jgi:hypothetical protein